MKIYLVGLLIIFLLYYQVCNLREGVDTPKRWIDPDLQGYIKAGLTSITLTEKAKKGDKEYI